MKKILGLAVAAMMVMAMVGAGTWAFFSDTESATGNILSAGTLDLSLTGANTDGSAISLANLTPGDDNLLAPDSVTLINVGNLTADLTIASGVLSDTESAASAIGTLTTSAVGTIEDTSLGGSDDDWNGYIVEITSGVQTGQSSVIRDYVATGGVMTLDIDLPGDPGLATYKIRKEFTGDGSGTGELDQWVTVSFYLNKDGALGYTGSASPGPTTDIQLLAGNNFDSAVSQIYAQLSTLDSQTWVNPVSLAEGDSVEFVVEYQFVDSGDQNTAQGDSLGLDIDFTLYQQ